MGYYFNKGWSPSEEHTTEHNTDYEQIASAFTDANPMPDSIVDMMDVVMGETQVELDMTDLPPNIQKLLEWLGLSEDDVL